MSQESKSVSIRWLLLVITFVLLCFFGLIYAWSLFIEPLETNFGWERSQTSLIFTISCVTVCVGMVVSGILTSKFNYRLVMALSAVMIAVGFIASAFCNSLIEIFIYYGVLVGLGVGIGFNCAINTTLNWFPEKQGIVSGALLMGYGGGAMFLSPLVTMLLGVLDWRMTFGILGVLFGILVVLGAVLLRNPSPEQVAPLLAQARESNIVSSVDYTPLQIVKMPVFWICFIWLALSTSGGLALISQAVPAAMEVLTASGTVEGAVTTATVAMGSVSLCNGLGRLLNGFVWDKLGYRVSFTWISLAFVVGMLCCALAINGSNFPMLVAGFVLLGLTFGGTMSATSAVCGTFFGTKHFGINYAIMCCQMIPAAIIGPTLLAIMQTGSGSYGPAFWAFLVVAIVTAVSSVAIRRPKENLADTDECVAGTAEETLTQPA